VDEENALFCTSKGWVDANVIWAFDRTHRLLCGLPSKSDHQVVIQPFLTMLMHDMIQKNSASKTNSMEIESEHGLSPANTKPDMMPLRWHQRWIRQRYSRLFRQVPDYLGMIVRDADGEHALGNPHGNLCASMNIHDPAVYRMIALQGSLGACEAYLQGLWSTPDLVKTLTFFSQIFDTVNTLDTGVAWFATMLGKMAARFRRNSRTGSKKNIAAHYDLSNEFFALFLDPSMMYSSACYDAPDVSLEEASQAKLRKLCRKLQLESSDHLLEIGTGWGGFALHATRHHGCRVTTTTISKNQHDYVQQEFQKASLGNQITLLQQDYRDLRGHYDKIVSIEMIEAVGKDFLVDYFRCCNQLLKPGGRFIIQAIVIPEQRYDIYARSVDFIQTYIFPGCFLPSIASMQQAVGECTSLRMVGLQDCTPSYVLTLREWRRRFHLKLDVVRQLGFDERFIRMWDFYLASCEAVFHERAAGLVQIEWVKV